MLSTERERLERREEAKAEAVDTVAAAKAEALAKRDALRKEAGYPAPVQRTDVGEVITGQTEDQDSEEVKPYGEWTNEALSEELKARDLPHSGNKDELVARLEESDKAEDE